MVFKKGQPAPTKGRTLSEEHKRKLSEAHKGYVMPEEQKRNISKGVSENLPSTAFKKGNAPWNKGKDRPDMYGNQYAHRKHTSEENAAKSKRQIGNTYAKDCKHTPEMRLAKSIRQHSKNSHFWQGGLTAKNAAIRNGIDFKLWREAVYKKDNWTCQACGATKGTISPHHILNFADYPDERFVVDNGITLCINCHTAFHARYGRRKTNRQQLNEFLGIESGDA